MDGTPGARTFGVPKGTGRKRRGRQRRGARDDGRGAAGAGRRARERRTTAWGDDEAGGSGAGRGTAKDELPKGGEGRGNKPPINRFHGNYRTEMLATIGTGRVV